MKKRLFILSAVLILCLAAVPAQAGRNPLAVAADGDGIPVYAKAGSSKAIGILYNGFTSELPLSGRNGRFSCELTPDLTVWVNQEKAQRRLPDRVSEPGDPGADEVPCACFLAEVTEDGAKLWSGTGHKRVLAEHAAGTLVMVCGEFGNDWYVERAGIGLMAKTALRRVKDLTFPETGYGADYGLDGLRTAAVCSDGQRVLILGSAEGVSALGGYGTLEDGWTVTVLAELGDWVQLTRGGFIEKRFLDPEGDHTVPSAVIRTDAPPDRLQVREAPRKGAETAVKLCAGLRVQTGDTAGGWTYVYLSGGPAGGSFSGWVQSSYLADGPGTEDCGVPVRLLRDAKDHRGGTVPAGTGGRLIGVIPFGGNSTLLVRLEDGRILKVKESPEAVLEPAGDPAWTGRTAKRVNLREAPDTGSRKLAAIPKGASLEVLFRGEKWALVRYKDQTGYILNSALRMK